MRRRDRRPLLEVMSDGGWWFGADLWERSKPRHNLWPQLARLEREGVLESRWVDAPENPVGRRRAYRLVRYTSSEFSSRADDALRRAVASAGRGVLSRRRVVE